MPYNPPVWLLAVLCAAQVYAQSLQGINGTSQFNPTTNKSEQVGMAVKRIDGMPTPNVLTLYPLTEASLQDLPDNGLSGSLFAASTSNIGNITSASMAWISCDESDYPGFQGPIDVLEKAVANNATASVLYSRVSSFCHFTAGGSIPSSYGRLYSMSSARDSGLFQNMMQYMPESEQLHVSVNLQKRLQQDNGSNNGSGPGEMQQQPGGPSPSTAVAMIILYSITGVITALFLIIIVTGAIRAHRHPDRYGPRAILGRARQSRAKGLARAMLDSIPIVKFGDSEGDIPKSNDVELAGSARKEDAPETSETTQLHKPESSTETRREEDPLTGADAAPRPSYDSEGGIRADTARVDVMPTQAEHEAQGCSICTEDFERGEDVRVLPCNHKFHPPCIDPWLLNVSGTCPLCRIDLRPPTSHDAENPDADGGSATNGQSDIVSRLGVPYSYVEGLGSRRASHRLSFIFDPLNRRRMQDATPEERIDALRQYNERHSTEDSRRRRVSNRLSTLLGRGRGQDSSPVDASRAVTPPSGAAGSSVQHLPEPSDATRHDTPPVGGESAGQHEPSAALASGTRTPVADASTSVERASNSAAETSTSTAEAPTSAASIYEEAREHGSGQVTKSS